MKRRRAPVPPTISPVEIQPTSDSWSRLGAMLTVSWWTIYPAATALVAELLVERTWLTWRHGPQPIGALVAHRFPLLFLVGALGLALAVVWMALLVVETVRRRTLTSSLRRRGFLLAMSLLLALIPASAWQALLVLVFGPARG